MQTLDVISVNIWQILASLLNLLVLFLILKRFLYKPVRKVLAERQKKLDDRYAEAENAVNAANADKAEWDERIAHAKSEADGIVESAVKRADSKSDKIIADAKTKAELIVKDAERQAELEKKKAESEIKGEIIDVSLVLTEKILNREISAEDHSAVIDSVIAGISNKK